MIFFQTIYNNKSVIGWLDRTAKQLNDCLDDPLDVTGSVRAEPLHEFCKITVNNAWPIKASNVIRLFFCPLNNIVQLHRKIVYESESVLTEEQCNNSVNSIKKKFNFLAQAFILLPLCLSSSYLTLFSFLSQCSFIFHATS